VIKNIKIVLLAWLLAMASSGVLARNLVVDRAIFEDPTGQLDLKVVKTSEFSAAPEVVFKGFSRSTFWLKLKIEVPKGSEPVSVRIRPNLLDRATLFYTATPPGGVEREQPINDRAAQQDTRIALPAGIQTLYLRFESMGGLLVHAQVLTLKGALAQDLRNKTELGAVLAIYGVALLITLGLTLARRETLPFFLLLHLAICLQHYLLFNHIRFEMIPWDLVYSPSAFRLLNILNFLGFSLLMLAFISRFKLVLLQYVTGFGVACFGILAILFFFMDPHGVLKATAVLGPLITFALLGGLAYSQSKFLKDKKINLPVRLAFGLVNILFVVTVGRVMLQILGGMEDGTFLLESPVWRGIFIPLYLLGFLWQRDAEQRKALLQSKVDQAVGAVLIKDQANRLATQSAFMAMLMHEIKTPLFTIQLAAASWGKRQNKSSDDVKRLTHIEKSIGEINFIIDECIQADKLDQSELAIQKSALTLADLFFEWMHLPGHERLVLSGIDQTRVLTDSHYSQIILKNLISNALKYSEPGSHVCVDVLPPAHADDRVVQIRIANTPGKAGRPDPEKVFKRYYREEGARMESGAGLGLWLAQTLALKLGSELRCDAEHGRVNFYFPLELI
jgi:two-component system, sensor histidine kinase LadS